jgi:hypothetical protein
VTGAVRADWLAVARRYLAAAAAGNLAWEAAQMPLYTLWQGGSPGEIAFAVVHCTLGNVLIARAALFGALLLSGAPDWPRSRRTPVAVAAIAFGLAYTAYSERVNLARGAWAYAEAMPTVPWLGVGLAPLAQWLVIPAVCLAWACSARGSRAEARRAPGDLAPARHPAGTGELRGLSRLSAVVRPSSARDDQRRNA